MPRVLLIDRNGESINRTPKNVFNQGVELLFVAQTNDDQEEALKAAGYAALLFSEALGFGITKAAAMLAHVYANFYKDYEKTKLYILVGSKLEKLQELSDKESICSGFFKKKCSYPFDLTEYFNSKPNYNRSDNIKADNYAKAIFGNKIKYQDQVETEESITDVFYVLSNADESHDIGLFNNDFVMLREFCQQYATESRDDYEPHDQLLEGAGAANIVHEEGGGNVAYGKDASGEEYVELDLGGNASTHFCCVIL